MINPLVNLDYYAEKLATATAAVETAEKAYALALEVNNLTPETLAPWDLLNPAIGATSDAVIAAKKNLTAVKARIARSLAAA
jgi:hypothetical protein